MRRLVCLLSVLFGAASVFCVRAQGHVDLSVQSDLQVIEIGVKTTTHVLFTSDLTYVDISSKDVISAKVVDASKNMLALKAKEEFDYVTTISALEANGTMHTFMIKYSEFPSSLVVDIRPGASGSSAGTVNTQIRPVAAVDPVQSVPVQQPKKKEKSRDKDEPASVEAVAASNISAASAMGSSSFSRVDAPTLEEVMNKGQRIYHIGDKNYQIEAYCVNVFVYSDQTYFIFRLKNGSSIGYEASDAQFNIESRKEKRNAASSAKSVWPQSNYGTLSCNPQSETMVGYTVPKFTLLKNEVLRVYIYEKVGNRNLVLTFSDKDINYAVSPI